jgi:chitinase
MYLITQKILCLQLIIYDFSGYDVPKLTKYFDWISVMTYDFHGHWDKQTGHVAPLYYYPGDTYDHFNAVSMTF